MKDGLKKYTIFFVVIFLSLFFVIRVQATYNWTETQPAGDTDKSWREVSSDSDGSHLIAGVTSSGRLYTSSNGGTDWTERQPAGAVDTSWYIVDSDADGSNLLAGVFGGRLYTSSNGGADWTERQPLGNFNANWNAGASDSTGTNLIVAVSNGRLYTSSNGGANWTERQPAGDADATWAAVASDSTGTRLLAGTGNSGNPGRLYVSSDSGVTWVEHQPRGDSTYTWRALALDSDGSDAIVGIGNSDGSGRLYTGLFDESPAVSITEPDDDDVVRGTIGVTASASDDVSVSGVQFKRDTNTLIGSEDTSSPYSVSFDTTAVTDGEYDIIAVARDSGGNYATSTAVTITIDNTAPTLSITTPTEGQTITEWTNPTVSWGDSDTCEYKLNSDSYTTVACTSPVTVPTPAEGSHTLTIRGTDEAGNITTSTAVSFTYEVPVVASGIVSSGSTGQRRQELLAQNSNSAIHSMIQELKAHVAVLQNLLNNIQPTTNSNFTRDLELGDTGEDVRSLQKFLNSKGFTIATTGPGSPGNETSIFGRATQQALIRYQQSMKITPAVGYFGPVTRSTTQ